MMRCKNRNHQGKSGRKRIEKTNRIPVIKNVFEMGKVQKGLEVFHERKFTTSGN